MTLIDELVSHCRRWRLAQARYERFERFRLAWLWELGSMINRDWYLA